MLILISILLLFVTALALLILRITQREFRFAWLTALSGTVLAWLVVLLWQTQLPLSFTFPSWQPASLFTASPGLSADGLAWPYAFSLVTLTVAILLTSSVREDFPNSYLWAVEIALCGIGLMAVTAVNPLTLALVWAALDLSELIAMLREAPDQRSSERAVIAFSTRAAGIILLLLANAVSAAAGKPLDFLSTPPQAGLLLLAAAGLRLGVLPLHLPYHSESSLRRGLGTMLRLVSSASSLILLARIPTASLESPVTPLLLILSAIAALYGGWMWMRAPDELTGRPFWMIGLASLAVASALFGDPTGTVGWGIALVLTGGALFLSSLQQIWLNRALWVGAWALSSLPFSLTAFGWQNNTSGWGFFLPVFLIAQAFIMTGYVRHAMRPSTRAPLSAQPVWAKMVYPAGIGLLLLIQFILGFVGWDGAFAIGTIPAGIAASLLTLGLLWATPRFAFLNPVRAHWVQPSVTPRLDQLYQNLWVLYRWLGRLTQSISNVLEGDGGIMWTLLFLIFFVLLITQRKP
ncbi:MAG: hypothetical protein M1282_14910 [Chloroflexi bacterium]|nr:hypothetical protein [Chloroflexota bacterium]